MNAAVFSRENFMPLVGGIVVAAFLAYLVFFGADTWGLPQQRGHAVVVHKTYKPLTKGYINQTTDGRVRVVPRTIPESYLLTVDIDGEQADVPVSKELFDRTAAGDRLNAIYQQRRLTRALQVIEVAH